MSQLVECCPLCGEDSRRLFVTQYEAEAHVANMPLDRRLKAAVYCCKSCDFRFSSPTVDENALRKLYEESGTDVWADSVTAIKQRNFGLRYESIKPFVAPGKVLDIGCYSGNFLNVFSEDWDIYGVEPSASARRVAESKGVKVVAGDIAKAVDADMRFNLITSLNVLEHVKDPKKHLEAIHTLLEDDGVFFCETGDYSTLFARAMGAYWPYYHIPEHVSFFSSRGIKKMLEQNGFDVLLSNSSISHRQPLNIKQRVVFFQRALMSLSLMVIIKTLSAIGISTEKRVPWVTYKDHFFVIAKKRRG